MNNFSFDEVNYAGMSCCHCHLTYVLHLTYKCTYIDFGTVEDDKLRQMIVFSDYKESALCALF